MNSKHYLRLLWACLSVAIGAAAPPPRPNIVLIISDDQGYTDYGFMGHQQIQTPHLDRLASQSLVFRRGYVPTSLCCPSLASIITGLYPHQHQITSNDPPSAPRAAKGGRGSTPEVTARWNAALDRLPTLPRLLAARGYRSFQTGKWWHGDFSRGGFTHGMTKGARHGDAGLTIGREGLQPIYDFIAEARARQQPFFVWYAPMLPHTPHNPPERFIGKYQGKKASQHMARYWAMCEWFDATCGELLAHLDQKQLAENTIVLYLADNGWVQAPDKNGFAPKNKTTPFDFGHRTPILLRWPGRIQPRVTDELACSLDVVPTLCAALGIEPPANLPGANLLDARAVTGRQHLFGECFTVRSQTLDDPAKSLLWRWMVTDKWRLIVPRTYAASGALADIPSDRYLTPDLITTLQAAKPMLFDIRVDPREERDLATRHPDIVAAMIKTMDAWWKP
ncbi:MAG: sulfatase [Verrucomicrobia bacterium]|nr:sulfatase [Verrucomicrobiota bacterium]